jgi:hypothetical protein
MDTFQKFILFAAIIILIIALVFIGIALSYSKDTAWPPITPDCPDYWTMDASSSCVNIKDLGNCPAQSTNKHLTMDFNAPAFTGSNQLCSKYTWAKKCGVSWDGITYGVNNPCQDI